VLLYVPQQLVNGVVLILEASLGFLALMQSMVEMSKTTVDKP
jgi:hypothetical protein